MRWQTGDEPRLSSAMARTTRFVLIVLVALLGLMAASMIGRFGRGDRSTGFEPPGAVGWPAPPRSGR